jgi:hypothetical protein
MIESKTIELMNLVIDGVASSSERAELDSRLSADPNARSYYEALSRLVRRLDSDPMIDPPAELEPRILDAVGELPPARQPRIEDGSPSWLRSFFSPRLRPWSTFGLGLAAGVFLLAAVQYGRPGFWDAARDIDPNRVSGSMVSDAARGSHPLATLPVEAENGTASGSLMVYRLGADIAVDVTLQSTMAVEWSVTFDPDAWTLRRVERKGTATAVFAANRSVIQGLHTGEGGMTLVFAGPPGAAKALVLKVLQGGQPVFEGSPAIR